MSSVDWIILVSFLSFVVVYGTWKSKGSKDVSSYLLTNRTTRWFTITLSIMATQASAITFLSTPGQAYVDGMRFIQFYLGLPVAMVILSITAVPLYHRLKVFTAYEYLEKRFDLKNRILGSVLFLTQRGLAAGFTIFAPSLIISVILGWDINLTIFIIGGLVIIYTAAGGTNAVNKTHILQMAIIMIGMFTAFFMIIFLLPPDISFFDAARIAGKLGKLNAIDFSFNFDDRYNFWSGIIGGTFLMLSYFGTDQSQVQRYLAGSSTAQSKIALLMNGLVKIPMQFFILLTGVMVFIFYQFVVPPLFFNPVEENKVKNSIYSEYYIELENQYTEVHSSKMEDYSNLLKAIESNDDARTNDISKIIIEKQGETAKIKEQAVAVIKSANPGTDTNDVNYIFLNFVIHFLPVGVIGLVLASIISASMSSTAAELNALASTTVIDIYKRLIKKDASDKHYLAISKIATVMWGLYALIFALFANRLGTLIEAVNILGSLVYGTILGIFLSAFYLKKVGGSATFYSALIAEAAVLYCYLFTDIPFLWFNAIGCLVVVFLSILFQRVIFNNALKEN